MILHTFYDITKWCYLIKNNVVHKPYLFLPILFIIKYPYINKILNMFFIGELVLLAATIIRRLDRKGDLSSWSLFNRLLRQGGNTLFPLLNLFLIGILKMYDQYIWNLLTVNTFFTWTRSLSKTQPNIILDMYNCFKGREGGSNYIISKTTFIGNKLTFSYATMLTPIYWVYILLRWEIIYVQDGSYINHFHINVEI